MLSATKKWLSIKLSSVIMVPFMIWFLLKFITIYDENHSNVLEFFSDPRSSLMRIVIPPSESVPLIYQLSGNFKYYLDWGGALIWLEVFELSEGMFESIRKKAVKLGGYVTMIKNSDYLPYVEDVFTTNKERFNISQSIKKSFDPKRILNPGKMYIGI